jgi:hypothetical protein
VSGSRRRSAAVADPDLKVPGSAPRRRRPATHAILIGLLVALLALCTVQPFLPGRHDPVAVPLSVAAQLLGAAGLLLVPIGLPWLIVELRGRAGATTRYRFALAALGAASILATVASLILGLVGLSVGAGLLAASVYAVVRLLPRARRLRAPPAASFHPAPLYLVLVPVAAVLAQVLLAAPAAEFSRNTAITASAELIDEIERHRATFGAYPSSLAAVWPDYHPAVVGIERFHYVPNGEAYNLFFEQPRFLFDNLGTREFVMYNRLGEHVMPSHASWILLWSPEELRATQGWYSVHDAGQAHWKYFWFD